MSRFYFTLCPMPHAPCPMPHTATRTYDEPLLLNGGITLLILLLILLTVLGAHDNMFLIHLAAELIELLLLGAVLANSVFLVGMLVTQRFKLALAYAIAAVVLGIPYLWLDSYLGNTPIKLGG